MEILISARFIISYMVPLPLFFPRKVFERSRHLGVSLFLFEELLGIGFSQMIICKVGVLNLLTVASCVIVVGRQ